MCLLNWTYTRIYICLYVDVDLSRVLSSSLLSLMAVSICMTLPRESADSVEDAGEGMGRPVFPASSDDIMEVCGSGEGSETAPSLSFLRGCLLPWRGAWCEES